ncbi:TPA: DUF359 domain-containing protein [Thermoplasmata archaeon]|nr:DUF359 domain-containing protein [Thermoplasmata archaeon]
MSTASSPSEFDEDFPERDLRLPDDMREELAREIGDVVTDPEELRERLKDAPKIVSVGDVVTMTLLQMDIQPDVAVFDYKTKRSDEERAKERIAGMSGTLIRVRNPQGMITRDLWRAVRDAVRGDERVKVEVTGEEDLASLVALACSPEGAYVIYGLPGRGPMVVPVDSTTRAIATSAIRRMRR